MKKINTFDEYESNAEITMKYKSIMQHRICAILGLSGEAGEVSEKFKKLFRGDCDFNGEFKRQIALELGDILWYVTSCAKTIDLSLNDIANMNIKKLKDRSKRGKIKGSGDMR